MAETAKTPTTPEANKLLKSASDELMMYLRLFPFNSIDDLVAKVSGVEIGRPQSPQLSGQTTGQSVSEVAAAVAPISATDGAPNNAEVAAAVEQANNRAKEVKDDPNTNDSRVGPVEVKLENFPESFLKNYTSISGAAPVLHMIMNESGKASNFSSRGADIVAMFANLIPTIELSKCVPYLRINFIQAVTPTAEGQMPFLTLESFLGAARAKSSDVTQTGGYNAGIAGIFSPASPPGSTVGNYQTGMELFLAPQTLVNPSINQSSAYRANRGIRVLDPMQPLMSLENINIDVSAVSQNLMQTQQKIDLSLILHDRSRVAEISPLVSPTVFPTISVVIEWGWSHPDTNPFSPNVYARFLNGLRSKQVYSIFTASLSNRDATSLNVKVQLISFGDHVTRAAAVTTGTAVDGTRYVPYDLVKARLNQIVRSSETNKTDATNKSTTNIQVVGPDQVRIENPGWPTSDKWVKYDDYSAFVDAISAAEKDVKKAQIAIERYRSILTQVAQSDDSLPVPRNLSAELSKVISDEVARMTYNQSGYLAAFGGSKSEYLKGVVKTFEAVGNVSALGDLIFRLYTFPLSASRIFDEIRIVTYDCNDNAGLMGSINIGCIPIPNADVIGLSEGSIIKPKMTIKSALQQIIKNANSKSALAYGFRSTYVTTAEIQKEAAEAETDASVEEAAETQKVTRQKVQQEFDAQRAAIEQRRSGIFPENLSENSFTPPRIKVEEVVVPLKGGGQGLHVYIYDEANSGYRHVSLITSILNTQSGKVTLLSTGGLPDNDRVKIEKVTDPSGRGKVVYNATIDRETAKSIATYAYPTIRIGTAGSVITNASYTSSTSGEVANINILNGFKSQINPAADESGPPINADLFVIPVTVTLTMLGMPLINRGQVYYIDFGTGTTIDNVYVVTTVKHVIKAGSFSTTVTLNPLNSGTVKSVASALESASASAYLSVKPPDASSSTSSGTIRGRGIRPISSDIL